MRKREEGFKMDRLTDWSKEEWIYGVVEPNWVEVAEFVVLPRTVAENWPIVR